MPSFDQPRRPAAGVSPWIARFAPLIPAGGAVLDLAAGNGRHARYLLERGHGVTAVDIDAASLADLREHPHCEVLEMDLESGGWAFAAAGFDGIVVTNYLHRPHFPHLVRSLAPDGVLLVESFGAGNERFGRPRNPDFLLQAGELLGAFAPALQIVAYEHGYEHEPRPAIRQRICAVKAEGPRALAP